MIQLPDPQTCEQLLASAHYVLEAQQAITQQYGGLLPLLQGDDPYFVSFQHYPQKDRIDYDSGNQYFYHCHREDMVREEHGHIHCFLRSSHVPDGISLPVEPNKVVYDSSPMTHIIAIALNRYGMPIRLFTTNRWVSKEQWYSAKHVRQFAQDYTLRHCKGDTRYGLLDQWVHHMMQLFLPQIHTLLDQRDEAIARHKRDNSDESVYECRDLEELSSLDISLEQHIIQLSKHGATLAHVA